MLEYIETENFQKLKSLRVEFDPFLTVFSGRNGAGKSTVIRALQWVMENAGPSLENLATHGTKSASVVLGVDGHVVKRLRTASVNEYYLDDEEGKEPFTAFGVGVPTAIKEVMKLGPYNFQTQLTSPFWVLDSGGQVARGLNAIVDLEIIDKANGELAGKLAAAKATAERAEKDLSAATASVKSFGWVLRAGEMLREVKGWWVALVEHQKDLEYATDVVERVRQGRKEVSVLQGKKNKAAGVVAAAQSAGFAASQYDTAAALVSSVRGARARIKAAPRPFIEVEAAAKASAGARKTEAEAVVLLNAVRQGRSRVAALRAVADKLKSELNTVEVLAAPTPPHATPETKGMCPTCRRPL